MKIHKLTASQKTFGAIVFALVAGLSVLFTVKSVSLQQPLISTSAQPIGRAELPPLHTVSKLEAKAATEMNASANTIPLNRAFNVPGHTSVQASWQMGGVKAAIPSIPLSEKIADYGIVELQQKPASFPAVGEQVLLPMLHGKNVVAIVESAVNLANGDYSWSGHLHGHGSDYPVVMTYGERSVFATITTPDGSYTMESTDGVGWLYKNPAEIELSNPDAKDFLEIDGHH